jgi:hypothetical protein
VCVCVCVCVCVYGRVCVCSTPVRKDPSLPGLVGTDKPWQDGPIKSSLSFQSSPVMMPMRSQGGILLPEVPRSPVTHQRPRQVSWCVDFKCTVACRRPAPPSPTRTLYSTRTLSSTTLERHLSLSLSISLSPKLSLSRCMRISLRTHAHAH